MAMRKYFRHFKRMEQWTKLTMWVERGYLKPPEDWEIIKLFPYKHNPEDVPYYRKKMKVDYSDPLNVLKKNFLTKYPEHLDTFMGENATNLTLIDAFVEKQYKLMKSGYNEYKAFEMVETELANNLQKEKRDRAIVEELTLSNRSRSLMDVFEQREEFIQRQKVKRLERDLPEFMRNEYNISLLNYDPNSTKDFDKTKSFDVYEPATYYLSNKKITEKDDDKKKENFLLRSESILKYYHSIGEINDGLDTLQDREIQRLSKESSQRFKIHMSTLLKKLEKHGVKLNDEGRIDLNSIKDSKALNFVKKQEQLCTIVLLSKDLDFEIPHQARLNEIKYEILNEIKAEQDRLMNLYSLKKQDEEKSTDEPTESYEDIYALDKKCKLTLN